VQKVKEKGLLKEKQAEEERLLKEKQAEEEIKIIERLADLTSWAWENNFVNQGGSL